MRADSACLTAVNSNVLPRSDRWRLPVYEWPCRPAVYDLSPDVLGLSEGFSQASYNIYSALPFDHQRDLTWKVRGVPGAGLRLWRADESTMMVGETSGVHRI